jgi:uncharacterized protein YecE (DUF72 family)
MASLSEYFVGSGGWSYFKVENNSSLKSYSQLFNFVEVNYTFYQYPTIEIVETWKRSVPENFVFSVRCHQDLTHKFGLKPQNQAYEVFYRMKAYCNSLNSPYLILQTPPKYVIIQENFVETRDFFSSLNLKNIRLVWEYRAPITPIITDLMRDFNIIRCVDLSKGKAEFHSDVTYSRLFGKGKHNLYQFTDDELSEIDQNAQETKSKTVFLSFHSARMYTDASRFKRYKDTGKFLPVTNYIGVDSAKAVLAEDAKFPTSKSALKVDQGWKVIDLTHDKRVHLSDVIDKLPDKTYSNIDDVINDLKAVL